MLKRIVKLSIYLLSWLIPNLACYSQHKPQVVNGVLDMQKWHFEEQGIVNMQGKWRFYWEQLHTTILPDTDFVYHEVSGMWNNVLWHNQPLSAYGYGTYHLKIVMGNQHKNKRLAFKTNYINSSCIIFINGQKVDSIGKVATKEKDYVPKINPSIYAFDVLKDTIELTIQVANYQDRFGGVVGNIFVGTEEQIRHRYQTKINFTFFIMGILLVMGLYHLSLFFFRHKNRAALYFGLLCIIIFARMLVTDEHVITDYYTDMSHQLSSKVSYISFYLGVVFICHFFHAVYHQDFSKKIRNFVAFIGAVSSIIVLFTKLSFFSLLLGSFQVFTLCVILYIFYMIGVILWKKREGSIIFSAGVLAIVIASINDILHANETINTFVAAPLGLLLFIFSQTLLLSSLFSKAFKNIENLGDELAKINANLEEKVKERTDELNTTNQELNQTLEELHQNLEVVNLQRSELSDKNVEITSSLNYAQRIQQTILPQPAAIQAVLPESFVLFMPRDIVSGDFYWFLAKDSKIIIVAADCTGHGVPGAFMTIIGNQLLSDIIENKQITEADQILNMLQSAIRKTMKQDETGNREGMDVSLVVIDKEKKTMDFAGAKNPIIYIQNGQMHHIKGDKITIGGEVREKAKLFNKHTIDISVRTTFYLFSDGYQDQFGGKDDRKLMLPKMKELFLEIHKQEMPAQKAILESTLLQWIAEANERQIDDILLIGCTVDL
ncbi:MAG: hypothetical protein EAZ08_03585 [Cytophagales bacterium]|nr:MAG: hypothetical protein EAZ08_03585 [Cytophagales bacterium]